MPCLNICSRIMKLLVSLVFILISSQTFAQCPISFEYGNNPEAGHYAEVNGIKMYYEAYGKPENPPLLIIHGNGGSVSSGRCQIEYFKEKFYTIVPDSRYQGKSGWSTEELTYTLIAKDYNALLTSLGIDSVNVIGQSDGGIVGLILAMDYPDKVKKLVASAPNILPDSSAVCQWSIDDVSRDLAAVEAKQKQGDQSEELQQAWALLNLMDKYPQIAYEELEKIKAPVLVITSDEDVIKPEHILKIYQHIPKAYLFVMLGATHVMLRDEYELFNQMAGRFLSQPFKRPTTKGVFHGGE